MNTKATAFFGCLILIANTSQAVTVEGKGVVDGNALKMADAACLQAVIDNLSNSVDAVETLGVSIPNPVSLLNTQGTLLTYSGVVVSGKHREATGAISCIVTDGGSNVDAFGVSFDGRGMAKFKKHPLARGAKGFFKSYAMGFGRGSCRQESR